jgi:hypothetical protein
LRLQQEANERVEFTQRELARAAEMIVQDRSKHAQELRDEASRVRSAVRDEMESKYRAEVVKAQDRAAQLSAELDRERTKVTTKQDPFAQ